MKFGQPCEDCGTIVETNPYIQDQIWCRHCNMHQQGWSPPKKIKYKSLSGEFEYVFDGDWKLSPGHYKYTRLPKFGVGHIIFAESELRGLVCINNPIEVLDEGEKGMKFSCGDILAEAKKGKVISLVKVISLSMATQEYKLSYSSSADRFEDVGVHAELSAAFIERTYYLYKEYERANTPQKDKVAGNKCTCGATICGGLKHTDYCDLVGIKK